jgi:hypothetical protein
MFYHGSPPPGQCPQRFFFFVILLGLLQNMVVRELHLSSYKHEEVQDPL